MKSLRLRIGMAVFSVLAAVLLVAASPKVARGLSNCTSTQLAPALGDVTVNQGLGNYTYRVRGKETLVKFFLTNPTTCTVTSTQSINITGATLTVSTAPTGSPAVSAFQSFGLSPAVTSAVSTNSPADPVFAVPSNYLTPTATDVTFTPTFTATVTYSRKVGTSTTSGLTATFSNSNARFDHQTGALRVLVVPMGDATAGVLANTQFTSTDQTATQNGFSALSRIFPVPGGVSALDGTGGIRYAINLSAMVNLQAVSGAYLSDGKFCGSAINFDAIKAQLAQFMQSWNSNPLNASKKVDRVLGVVGEGISHGANETSLSCADGMASVVSPEAWVRAIVDKPSSGKTTPAVPSRTGSLMAMELTHTWGGETNTTHHSSSIVADTTNPGRAYNVATRSYLATNRSVMKFSLSTNPPWDDTLTLLEPGDYSYDRCAFGGTIPTDLSCSGLGMTTGTTLGVAAGNSFIVSGTVNTATNTADIVQSGFLSSQLIGQDDSSPYRYVRRDSSGALQKDIGFHVSFEDTLHNPGAQDNTMTQKGLFSFALPDDVPAPGSGDEVQLWKVSSPSHTNPSTAGGDTLLYDKTQQPTAPEDLGFATLGAVQPGKYTDTANVDEVHPALSDDGNWIAWEASNLIHVARSTQGSPAITLPVPGGGAGVTDAFPAWNHNANAIAYAFDGDLYTQGVDTSGGTATLVGAPVLIYTGDPESGPGLAHHPSWSFDGGSIAFDAGGDIWTIPADGGGTAVQMTNDAEAEHDPSWSHRSDDNRIAFVRGPLGNCQPSTKLYVVDPATKNADKVGDEGCGLFPSFGTNGRIAFIKPDGNIWSSTPDGTAEKQLTIGGQDSFPSAAGNQLAFDRSFTNSCSFDECVLPPTQYDIMLTSLTASGKTAFSASSNVPLKAEVDHVVNGTAFPVYVGLEPNDVDGAIQTWYINFDGSNAPSGGVLQTLFTDGVQYTTGTSTVAPTVAAKPPTAAIFTPLDTTYQMGSTFPVSGTGYDAEGQILPGSSLHWTLTLPNGNVQTLGNFASQDIKAPLPAGWPAGTLTFTLTVTDANGQTATATRNVQVLFDLVGGGFLPPIKNPPDVNIAKVGTQYPIKWQIKDASGRYISDLKTVAGVFRRSDGSPPNCDFTSSTNPLEPLPTGGTVLRYDSKNNQFVYNWTTPSTPGCYVFQVSLTDGTDHQAYFQLS
jgi:hypothetical protein